MGIEGTYGFVYCGNRGLGIGVFLVEGQRIEGRDFAGGRYMGTAVQDGKGNIQLDVQMQLPALMAQGTAKQDLPHTRHIHWMFPPAFGGRGAANGGVRRAGHSDGEKDFGQERRDRKKRVYPRNDGALGRVHHPLKRRRVADPNVRRAWRGSARERSPSTSSSAASQMRSSLMKRLTIQRSRRR